MGAEPDGGDDLSRHGWGDPGVKQVAEVGGQERIAERPTSQPLFEAPERSGVGSPGVLRD